MRLVILAPLLFLSFLSAPNPTHAASARPLLIGDSIGVATASYLNAEGFAVNALVGRQFVTGIAVARSVHLPSRVVIELGTNGPISDADMRAMMGVLHPHRRRVSLVTCYVSRYQSWSIAYQWCGAGLSYGVNAVLAWAKRVWHRVRVARWDLLASSHPSWLCDGVHPCTAQGEAAFARLVAKSL